MPYALCPMPYALCPMPYACRVPHLSEKGYTFRQNPRKESYLKWLNNSLRKALHLPFIPPFFNFFIVTYFFFK